MRPSHRFTIDRQPLRAPLLIYSLSPLLFAPLVQITRLPNLQPFLLSFLSFCHLFTRYIKAPNPRRNRDPCESCHATPVFYVFLQFRNIILFYLYAVLTEIGLLGSIRSRLDFNIIILIPDNPIYPLIAKTRFAKQDFPVRKGYKLLVATRVITNIEYLYAY